MALGRPKLGSIGFVAAASKRQLQSRQLRRPIRPFSRPRSDSKILDEIDLISVCVLAYSQSCHFRLARLGIEPPVATVDLRMVPKHHQKYAQNGYPALACADSSKHATNNSVFSPDAYADTWYVLALLLQQLLYPWEEQRQSDGACVLRCCCRPG